MDAAAGGKVRQQRRLGPLPNIDGVSFEHTLAAEDDATFVEDTDEDCTSDEDEAEDPMRSLAGDMDNAADDADPDLDDLLQPEAGGAPDDEKRLDLVSTLVAAARVAAARVAAALAEEPAGCLRSSPPPAAMICRGRLGLAELSLPPQSV